jgi:polyisoprenoid-binding protein YceI
MTIHAMRNAAALVCVLAATSPAAVEKEGAYQVDPERTQVAFEVAELGVFARTGRFGRAHGRIEFDADAEAGSVYLVVDAASVDTGWDRRDAFVRGEHMLDAARFPLLSFRSTALGFAAHRLVAVDGSLTMRGVTRPVRLDVRSVRCGAPDGDRCDAEIVGRVSRRAFGMDFAWPLVGDEVLLTFTVGAVRHTGGPTPR